MTDGKLEVVSLPATMLNCSGMDFADEHQRVVKRTPHHAMGSVAGL
jgi:hypothetical protein